jgi:DNA-binding GntR family transcriptional regulator
MAEATAPLRAHELDQRWHEVLVSRLTNDVLAELITHLKQRVRRYEVEFFRLGGTLENSTAQHARIIAVLRDNDLRQARTLLEENWRSSRDRLLPWLESLVE